LPAPTSFTIDAGLLELVEIVARSFSDPDIEAVSLRPYWYLLPGPRIRGFGQIVDFLAVSW
jgi:hypothetical protein